MGMRAVALAVLVAGCASYYPHDRPVTVEIDSALDAYQVELDDGSLSQLGPLIVDGAHLWDVSGCHFHGMAEPGGGPVLRFVANGYRPPDVDGADAWWSDTDGEIHIQIPPKWGGDASNWRALAAHEIGHAMGLHHLNGFALMSPNTAAWFATDEDIAAVRRL